MPEWPIKTLWVGDALSKIEQLSLASFVAHGHRVELFTYQDVANIPDGVAVRDANQILNENLVFSYKSRPSYSAFANWFRYEMLCKEGGMWVDTDVVCLRFFDFDSHLVFGEEEFGKVNCAVIGGNANEPLFRQLANQCKNPNHFLPYDSEKDRRRKLYRRFLQRNQRGNIKWGETGPVGLTKALIHSKLISQALPVTAFYPIHPNCWNTIFDSTYPSVERFFPDSYAIHLWNEMIKRTPGYGKNQTYADTSLIEVLKKRYLD